MKKIYISILALCALNAQAQITIDFSDFGVIGDVVKVAQDTNPAVSAGPAGANQVWDFSSLQVQYNSINTFLDPSTQPNNSLFSGSNIVYQSQNFNAFINANTSFAEVLGADGDIVGAGVSLPIPFANSQKILNFPANYGDSFLDTTRFIVKVKGTDIDPSFSIFDSIRISHWGYASNELDAWGSMIVPGETKDVLRKKRVEYTVDTVWVKIAGIWQLAPPVPPFLSSNPRLDTLRTYEWYAKNEKYIYLTLSVDANDNATDALYIFKANLAVSLQPINLVCQGDNSGSITVDFSTIAPGVGPYTYLWSNGATTASLSGLAAGAYSVTVVDSNNDSAFASAVVTEPTAIMVTPTVVDAHCATCPNGSASVAVGGGTPGYTYLWSNGSTTSSIMDVVPATYPVSVTDINGCEVVYAVVVGSWPVSVDEVNASKNGFLVYPNPAHDRVFVKNATSVEIFDLLGNKVRSENNANSVDVSKLSAGIYVISAQVKGNVYSQKLTIK